jgi:hypothetical protein
VGKFASRTLYLQLVVVGGLIPWTASADGSKRPITGASDKNHVWQAYAGVARGPFAIVGGTATPQQSDATLKASYEASPAAGRLKLEAPYPVVVRSDDVPGLRPGLKVLILGLCRDSAATKPILRGTKGKRGEAHANTIYARAVNNPDEKLLPPQCPVLAKP